MVTSTHFKMSIKRPIIKRIPLSVYFSAQYEQLFVAAVVVTTNCCKLWN